MNGLPGGCDPERNEHIISKWWVVFWLFVFVSFFWVIANCDPLIDFLNEMKMAGYMQ